MEMLASLDLADTNRFFETFFKLPRYVCEHVCGMCASVCVRACERARVCICVSVCVCVCVSMPKQYAWVMRFLLLGGVSDLVQNLMPKPVEI